MGPNALRYARAFTESLFAARAPLSPRMRRSRKTVPSSPVARYLPSDLRVAATFGPEKLDLPDGNIFFRSSPRLYTRVFHFFPRRGSLFESCWAL